MLFSAPPTSQALLSPKFFCLYGLQAEEALGSLRGLVTATAGPSDLDMSEPQAGRALHCQHCLDTRAPRLSPHHQQSQRPQESCSWEGKEGVRAYTIVSVFLSQVSSAWGCLPQDTGQQGWNRPGAPKHWGGAPLLPRNYLDALCSWEEYFVYSFLEAPK